MDGISVNRAYVAFPSAYDSCCAPARYWPAFAQHGKEHITLADVLRHEAGLAFLTPVRVLPAALFQSRQQLAEAFESSPPAWAAPGACRDARGHVGGTRCYHGLTRGLILNEVFRRADPAHRSLGQFLEQEVARPLGLTLALNLGPQTETPRLLARLFDLQDAPLSYVLAQVGAGLWLPSWGFARLSRDALQRLRQALRRSDLQGWLLTSAALLLQTRRQPRLSAEIELPSAGVIANARALAQLAAVMVNGGQAVEPAQPSISQPGSRPQLLSAETLAHACGDQVTRYDTGMCHTTTYSRGGWCHFSRATGWAPVMDGFVGWGGLGGSLMVWHPQRKLAVAYTLTGRHLGLTSTVGAADPRCLALLETTLRCLDSMLPQQVPGSAGQPPTAQMTSACPSEATGGVWPARL